MFKPNKPPISSNMTDKRVTQCYSVKTGLVSTIVHSRGQSVSESSLDSLHCPLPPSSEARPIRDFTSTRDVRSLHGAVGNRCAKKKKLQKAEMIQEWNSTESRYCNVDILRDLDDVSLGRANMSLGRDNFSTPRDSVSSSLGRDNPPIRDSVSSVKDSASYNGDRDSLSSSSMSSVSLFSRRESRVFDQMRAANQGFMKEEIYATVDTSCSHWIR